MKKATIFIIFFIMAIWTASAAPLNLEGFAGPIYKEGVYLIDSSNMPGLLYDDAGSTAKFEVLSISPSTTVFSNKYIKYSDDFKTDRWKNDSSSFYGISRGTTFGVGDEAALYPEITDTLTYIRYRFNITNPVDSVILGLIGEKRDSAHNLTVWASQDNTTYSKILEFDEEGKTTKQVNIINYIKDGQTWIEFRFFRSSNGTSTPRIYDFSIDTIYKDAVAIPFVYGPVEFKLYSDDFSTDKWKNDSSSFYGISRGTTFGVGDEAALYPEITDTLTYIRYRFNITNPVDSVILGLIGDKRDSGHNLTVWASQDNTTYSKILEFDTEGKTTKQVNIINYIKDGQTWVEFRFFKSSNGTSTPRIYDFSINAVTYEWHPANVQIGGNIELPTRTIDRDHFYYFAPHYSSSSGPSKARVAYLGTKYPAIDINSQRAVLGRFIKNDADLVLTYGTPLSLGGGFMLEIEDMGKEDRSVVTLKKDGNLLERGIFEAGKTYSFKTEVAGVKDTELFKADVISVFRSKFNNRVELKHVYMLDTEATVVNDGESFGDFEVDLDDFDTDGDTDIVIRLKKDKTLTLDQNSTIDLFGGLSIKVADSDELRFAVIKSFTKSGTYQQTGPYGSYGQAYSINSFDAPGLFTYDMDKNYTLESLSISSSKLKINEIVYSSLNKNNRMAYLGKTYHVDFSEEKMLLNEILKDDDEKNILRYGSPIRLENFILELKDIGEETVLLQLKKDGFVLEESVVESGGSFVYTRSIEKKDVEIFNATVKKVFRSEFSTFVEIKNIRILNESAIVLKDGDTFKDDYEISITDINGDNVADVELKLKSGDSFSVNKDSTTEILGGYMSIKAYENTFLPVRSISVNVLVTPKVENLVLPETIATPAEKPVQVQIAIQEQVSPQKDSATEIQGTASLTFADKMESIVWRNPIILGSIFSIILSIGAYGFFRKYW